MKRVGLTQGVCWQYGARLCASALFGEKQDLDIFCSLHPVGHAIMVAGISNHETRLHKVSYSAKLQCYQEGHIRFMVKDMTYRYKTFQFTKTHDEAVLGNHMMQQLVQDWWLRHRAPLWELT